MITKHIFPDVVELLLRHAGGESKAANARSSELQHPFGYVYLEKGEIGVGKRL